MILARIILILGLFTVAVHAYGDGPAIVLALCCWALWWMDG